MMNTIEENLRSWDRQHEWSEDGDEWKGQAVLCGVPYETWKRSLIDTLILPNARGRTVLEIAPGHGRWSEHIAKVANRLILVDLSPRCIDHCQNRFANDRHIEYHVNDGRHLPDGLSSGDVVSAGSVATT